MNSRLVHKRLKELGWNLERFAANADFSMSTARNIYNGKTVSVDNARKAAKALAIPLAALLEEPEPAEANTA